MCVLCPAEKRDCPIDLYFLIDTSETIALQLDKAGLLVDHIKIFVEDFVKRLENEVYNSVVQISWSVGGLHFSMKQERISLLTDKNDFINKLKQVTYLGKGTFIDCAIRNMTKDMLSVPSKPNAKRFAVVITDGYSTKTPCGGVKEAAEQARDESIKLFAVASTKNVYETGLREIANSPAGLYRDNYIAVNLSSPSFSDKRTIDQIYKAMVSFTSTKVSHLSGKFALSCDYLVIVFSTILYH